MKDRSRILDAGGAHISLLKLATHLERLAWGDDLADVRNAAELTERDLLDRLPGMTPESLGSLIAKGLPTAQAAAGERCFPGRDVAEWLTCRLDWGTAPVGAATDDDGDEDVLLSWPDADVFFALGWRLGSHVVLRHARVCTMLTAYALNLQSACEPPAVQGLHGAQPPRLDPISAAGSSGRSWSELAFMVTKARFVEVWSAYDAVEAWRRTSAESPAYEEFDPDRACAEWPAVVKRIRGFERITPEAYGRIEAGVTLEVEHAVASLPGPGRQSNGKPGPGENPIADSVGRCSKLRPCYIRDRIWLVWAEIEGLTPAKIRDRWNAQYPGKEVGAGTSGYEVVKKGLRAAKRERKNTEVSPVSPVAVPGSQR